MIQKSVSTGRMLENKYQVGTYLEGCVLFFYPSPGNGVMKLAKLQSGAVGNEVKDVVYL